MDVEEMILLREKGEKRKRNDKKSINKTTPTFFFVTYNDVSEVRKLNAPPCEPPFIRAPMLLLLSLRVSRLLLELFQTYGDVFAFFRQKNEGLKNNKNNNQNRG
jgi:hypothetical protein